MKFFILMSTMLLYGITTAVQLEQIQHLINEKNYRGALDKLSVRVNPIDVTETIQLYILKTITQNLPNNCDEKRLKNRIDDLLKQAPKTEKSLLKLLSQVVAEKKEVEFENAKKVNDTLAVELLCAQTNINALPEELKKMCALRETTQDDWQVIISGNKQQDQPA